MKVLVTGASGQLGYDVCREIAAREVFCIGVDRRDFDITNPVETRTYLRNCCPEAVIHCAAYTNVDQAEKEPESCWAVNETGTKNVAQACLEIGAKLVYLSTDYVFDGRRAGYYEIDSPTAPLNVYGKSKLAGEQVIRRQMEQAFIVRTSWMFGAHGQNFVKAILRRAETQGVLQVVADQFGSPTYTGDLAKLLCDMVQTKKYGIYHAVNEGICSWAEFAREVLRRMGKSIQVEEISSRDYPSPVNRPANSRLSTESLTKAGFSKLPLWTDALKRYLETDGTEE